MPELYDVAAIGNAIVDVIAPATDEFIAANGLDKGAMMLVDAQQSQALYAKMAPGMETSGGSAANTIAGLASFGGKGAFMGKVADDQLGGVFAHDMRAIGARFENAPLVGGPATAVSMINVTPDGQRTMCTYLGASVEFTDADVDQAVVEAAKIVYLEGYLFDAEAARRAFAKAAALAHGSGRMIALTLSDSFVVERHRGALLGFIENQVDLLFANEAEVTALFETDDFDVAVAALRERVTLAAVTRSEKGSVILSKGERLTVAAEPVEKVVDTTGAGDQYAAGFMFGLSRGRPLQQCGKLASLAAAEVISHYGPRPQVSLQDLAASRGY
ncbi:carbohydrate kinase, PfkB family [Phenylobacterium zucineum HLK1]|uniref:Carbohydrate kinase, PfkB family n=1 Tax=Phenylobacterium zucineum (strain HLK1) TaxID=450851 RepID=B4RBJ3_PHEZH|nr:adenosine kinase [Phenylobacterium zucineum]ACG76453.1 carbohydrate kinase, PfkB family [Phenylobacterium zucineum HLK1]